MTYGPPPPYPPCGPPRRRLPLPAVIALAVLGLAFWGAVLSSLFGSDGEGKRPSSVTSSEPRISIEPNETPTPSMDEDMTEMVTNLAWGEQSESEKDDMCFGIRILGPEWAADQMRESQADRPENDVAWEIDWDLAADILADKCTERGY